jgi:restriction system protein
MARRSKAGWAGDVIGMVGALPWWVGVALVPFAYLVFHQFSQAPVPVPIRSGGMGSFGVQAMVAAAARVLQYVVPMLCLIGAGVSLWGRRARSRLAQQAAANQSARVVDGLSWQRFEQLVGETFRNRGFSVKETGSAGADGGVDLELRKESELHLVQCKHWKALNVSVDVVRQFYGVMASRGAASGYVVTSGHFTEAARRFAQGRHVHLIDGAELRGMLQDRQQRSSVSTGARPATQAESGYSSSSSESPSCPKCNGPMTRRVASRGSNAGRQFWGCTAYPGCRGTRAE